MIEETKHPEFDRRAPDGRVHPIVVPRRESLRWLRLAKHLNEMNDAVEHATQTGFIKRKSRRLDYELERLIQNATDARALLRHNDSILPPATGGATEVNDDEKP
jgi:hypothetical protein